MARISTGLLRSEMRIADRLGTPAEALNNHTSHPHALHTSHFTPHASHSTLYTSHFTPCSLPPLFQPQATALPLWANRQPTIAVWCRV
jgi:hypothetical protein